MFRAIPPRTLFSPFSRGLFTYPITRSFTNNVHVKPEFHILAIGKRVPSCNAMELYKTRTVAVSKSFSSTSQCYVIQDPAQRKRVEEEWKKAQQEKLKAEPEKVTTTSHIRPIFEKGATASDDVDMLAGLKHDLKIVKDTFALKDAPKEVFYIGMAGLSPYVVTSLSTLYLAWDINYAHVHGVGYFISGETAQSLLHVLEPIQVGLGAIILSFLGAVHWGLEMAEYGGRHTYKRYALGILAPALAWPTILLPVDYALIVQFLGFTGMYFADTNLTNWGWAPKWYGTYRFILTFIVGASIIVTLIGRGQIGDSFSGVQGPASYLKELRDTEWENLQKEDDERKRKLREVQKKAKGQERETTKDEDEDEDKEGNDDESGDEDSGENETDEKPAADPGKRAKGDRPGTQGVYSDDKQGGGKAGSTGRGPEPTGEKKGIQKPMPESTQKNTGMRG